MQQSYNRQSNVTLFSKRSFDWPDMSNGVAESPVEFPKAGEPAWRIALFFPQQGGWTESDHLNLDGGPLVEFDSVTHCPDLIAFNFLSRLGSPRLRVV